MPGFRRSHTDAASTISFLGPAKHPKYPGRSGQATWSEDLLLLLDRMVSTLEMEPLLGVILDQFKSVVD